MFCSNCAGYISADGELTLADFPYERVTTVSRERSEIPWWDSLVERGEVIDDLIIADAEDSMLVDELGADTPEDLMKKIEAGIE